MTPKPEEIPELQMAKELSTPQPNGDRIVISGISGMFPMSSSVKELSMILYDKINPVTSDNNRWKLKHSEISEYTGKVPEIDRFDCQFFMVHERLGNVMDPMARKLLEHSYQAIYDAGLSPKHLNGKKVGVYIGSSFSETEKCGIFDSITKTGYSITGCSKTMYANRISYWLNVKGPSMNIDDACCGSMVALEQACDAINSGICEAAIVGAANLCLSPHAQFHYNRCIKLSSDETTKSFDDNADGCTKSEAISVLFLQKAKTALRAYAELVYVRNEFISRLDNGTGQVFGFIRNPDTSAAFLKQMYAEAEVSPQAVEYIEACGSATSEADKAELQAIEKVFCSGRIEPLLVGSVISNIGFTDAASGVTALTKVLLGYHNGLIAGNLHCTNPRKDIAAIRDGRMSIVTKHEPFRGTYAAVNCLSVTGVNSHALLRGCSKPKDQSPTKSPIPRLVNISNRQQIFLKDIFGDLKTRPIDVEEISLFHNIHSTNISGHLGRGYIILDTDEEHKTVCLSEKMEASEDTKRPLWFVYSGMGSQWAGMGAQLMRIPIFAAAIERCHKALVPKGLDIRHIITSQDNTIFDDVLNSFVGIAAIQIGLTDILTALGLRPDKIMGHSVGELGCAYADGCLTAEEMILSAYCRGKASNDTPLIQGAMAAVGIGYKELQKLCPPSIDIACHNSFNSSTISGPEENIRMFVKTLTSESIFAKEVPSANIAYHSRYIVDAGPRLLTLLSKVIQEPKLRSERWLSTSVPQENWNEPSAKYCSPEYLTNNLLSSVLFEETSKHVPGNAVLVEIAPHGLLQAILRRSLPESCKNVPLTQRGHRDNALFLLEAIGNLYIEGYAPRVQELYPKVEFPVSAGTPHLAHHVQWNHSNGNMVKSMVLSGSLDKPNILMLCRTVTSVEYSNKLTRFASFCKFLISTYDDEHTYLKGNVVQGKILYPFAGALVVAWDTLAMSLGFLRKEISVRFQDVHLYSQPILHAQRQLKLNVSVNRGNGEFEVLDGDSKVATGYIFNIGSAKQNTTNYVNEKYEISSDEVYQHLSSRGYTYGDDFRSIHSADQSLTKAKLIWNKNWVTILDGLFQLNNLRRMCEGVSEPSQLRELVIDIKSHLACIKENVDGRTFIKAEVDNVLDCTRCGGVKLHNLKFLNTAPPIQKLIKLNTESVSDRDDNVPTINATTGINVSLKINNVGDLGTFHWEEALTQPGNGINILVEYAGVNISDVKRASGVIPFGDDEKYFGMDFSGLTERGERVMGLVKNGAISTIVTAIPELLWPVPTHWTLEEAATVPLAYLQALYYLCVKNQITKGYKVLIHGAAGALGQASVSIALAYSCQVFATVADRAKKRFLLKLFPQINEDAIGSSRDESFGDMVLNATNGQGCNIIISCVREGLKNISLKCAAFSGVTIDMVQIQNQDKYNYGMFYMTKQRSYIAADFHSILDSGNKTELKELQRLLSDGIARGFVRPLSRVTYASRDASRAFKLLAASLHRGRVLLQMRKSPTKANPRITCTSTSAHLIFWDGSSFGLQLANRLISRGATKLRIYCLQSTPKYLLELQLWKTKGIDVKIFHDMFNNSNDVLDVIEEANKQGPAEGIYVTTETLSNKTIYLTNIISHLDSASRQLCPLLKFFAVINVDSNIGQQTCKSRSKDGLPATVLCLPALNKINNSELVDEYSWNQSAADVTEKALRSKHTVLDAQLQPPEKPYLTKLITTIENEDENATLKELGLVQSLPVIKSVLRDVYHISLEDEEILMLTKKRLLQIEVNSKEHNLEKISGLNVFFSYVDFDELQATTDFVPMESLITDVDVGFADENKRHLFIISGLEGHYERFRVMSERIKLPVIVLQPGLDWPEETPQELAIRYSKILLDKFKLKKEFYLLGYEFGVFTALEIASILEQQGLTGTVYCLGEAPTEMKTFLESELSVFETEEALQISVARHMYALMTRGSPPPTENALQTCSSWSERIDLCVRSLLGRMTHSAQYARALFEAAYARIKTARRYSMTPRTLRSQLVLLRSHRTTHSDDECSLQRFSSSPVIVQDLTAPMAYVATDLQVPAVINRHLNNDVLQTYNTSNLCETYVVL